MRSTSLAIALAALLGGCASLSEDECRAARWEDIGYRDGAEGARRDRVAEHAEDCAEHGVAVAREDWMRGYEDGLESYCTPGNAVQVGLEGKGYAGVCPAESDREFREHWRAAHAVHEQRQRIASLEDRHRQLYAAWHETDSEQQRNEIRVELARIEERLFYERQRLQTEEQRLARVMHRRP